jgi:uncharacterized membrane protein
MESDESIRRDEQVARRFGYLTLAFTLPLFFIFAAILVWMINDVSMPEERQIEMVFIAMYELALAGGLLILWLAYSSAKYKEMKKVCGLCMLTHLISLGLIALQYAR